MMTGDGTYALYWYLPKFDAPFHYYRLVLPGPSGGG